MTRELRLGDGHGLLVASAGGPRLTLLETCFPHFKWLSNLKLNSISE